jgi:hypothetical protein
MPLTSPPGTRPARRSRRRRGAVAGVARRSGDGVAGAGPATLPGHPGSIGPSAPSSARPVPVPAVHGRGVPGPAVHAGLASGPACRGRGVPGPAMHGRGVHAGPAPGPAGHGRSVVAPGRGWWDPKRAGSDVGAGEVAGVGGGRDGGVGVGGRGHGGRCRDGVVVSGPPAPRRPRARTSAGDAGAEEPKGAAAVPGGPVAHGGVVEPPVAPARGWKVAPRLYDRSSLRGARHVLDHRPRVVHPTASGLRVPCPAWRRRSADPRQAHRSR